MSTAGVGGLGVAGMRGGVKGPGGKMASTGGDGVTEVVAVAGAGGGGPAVVSTGI